jgi:chromate transporter
MNDSGTAPTFAEALRFWFKLGCISFGGPTGQIAIMHKELVEEKKWIREDQFLHALNYCMRLPGPEAQQLATYIGWLLHKTRGGLAAGILFVLPAAFLLWVLSFLYVTYGQVSEVAAVLGGVKAAVLGIVAAATVKIGKKALKSKIQWLIAGTAFLMLFFLSLPFPLILVFAGLVGFFNHRLINESVLTLKSGSCKKSSEILSVSSNQDVPTVGRSIKVLLLGLTIWWLPILLIGCIYGWGHILFLQGVFFSKAALVTFGGAYAVLPYVAQTAVDTFNWLSGPEMIDGLGLAESTPGPLIMVLQFVGFVGGWNHPGELSPLLVATMAAIITVWATFVPSFIWIFLGAPFVERLKGNEYLTSILSSVTAAVVGVVLNLAVWFSIQVVSPRSVGIDYWSAFIALASFVAIVRYKVEVLPVVCLAGITGVFTIFSPF